MIEMAAKNKKMMLAGLFLSKFNQEGYEALGYKSFAEAYRGLAAVVGGPWRSVKQYRDEFDPVFDNGRKGWHKRKMHPSRKLFLDEYGEMGLEEFAQLVQTQFASEGDIDLDINRAVYQAGVKVGGESSFAARMMTGKGTENYFEEHYAEYPRFSVCDVKRTTDMGCGFDFKLTPPHEDFLGVEVKGLKKRSGQIQLTEKEFMMADKLEKRFYLYVVTNFSAEPVPRIIENPLNSGITFECKTNKIEQKVWTANLLAVA